MAEAVADLNQIDMDQFGFQPPVEEGRGQSPPSLAQLNSTHHSMHLLTSAAGPQKQGFEVRKRKGSAQDNKDLKRERRRAARRASLEALDEGDIGLEVGENKDIGDQYDTTEKMYFRLARFYEKYDPDRLSQLDAMIEKYGLDGQKALFDALTNKYGPEPGEDEEIIMPVKKKTKRIVRKDTLGKIKSGLIVAKDFAKTNVRKLLG